MSAQRNAVVTGGSRGLGRAVALALARAGLNVAILYRRDVEGAAATVAELQAAAVDGWAVQADVGSFADVRAAFAALAERWGSLHVLVNNAGVAPVASWSGTDPRLWQQVLATNLTGPFACLQAARPLLRAAGDEAPPTPTDRSVVNVSSAVALTASPFGPAYAAAKAGLLGLTRSAAWDLGREGIRVNAILPGAIDSELARSLPAPVLEGIIRRTPLGRPASFTEIAEWIAFLASPRSAPMTGQSIVVDGGLVMH